MPRALDHDRRSRPIPSGNIHIDFAEVWTEEGKLYLFVAIDRVSKFAFAELHDRATRRIAADFLRRLLEHVPYRIHTVLTDNGFQFTEPRGGWSVREIQGVLAARQPFRGHAFDFACAQHGIDHRLTKFNHPWTNGQVERMNRTIKDATVRRFFYTTHASLRAHLATFLNAYNFAKRLKSLRGRTPFERICHLWTEPAGTIQTKSPPPHGGTEHPSVDVHVTARQRGEVDQRKRELMAA